MADYMQGLTDTTVTSQAEEVDNDTLESLFTEDEKTKTDLQEQSWMSSIGDGVKAVASDIGEGITEAPRAIIRGGSEAVNSMLDLAGSATELIGLGKTVGNLDIPLMDAPDSNTGVIIEKTAQFLTGFAIAGSLTPARMGAGLYSALYKGAISDFAAFNGHEENLANLIETVPGLANPVTEFMASNTEDPEIVGRLKNAVLGLGFGAATEGLVKGIRAIAKHNVDVDAAAAKIPFEGDEEAKFQAAVRQHVGDIYEENLGAVITKEKLMEAAKPTEPVKANMDLGREYMQKHVGSKALNGGAAAMSDPAQAYGTLSHSQYTLKDGTTVTETVNGFKASGAKEIALWLKSDAPEDSRGLWYKIATAKKGDNGELEHIVVAPEYQRQGVGEYLTKKAKTVLGADIAKTKEFSEAGAGLANKVNPPKSGSVPEGFEKYDIKTPNPDSYATANGTSYKLRFSSPGDKALYTATIGEAKIARKVADKDEALNMLKKTGFDDEIITKSSEAMKAAIEDAIAKAPPGMKTVKVDPVLRNVAPDIYRAKFGTVYSDLTERGGFQRIDGPGEAWINFGRINNADDVVNASKAIAEQFSKENIAGIRANRSRFAMASDAKAINAFETLVLKDKLNLADSEQMALGALWYASGKRLTNLAVLSKQTNSAAVQFAFFRQIEIHRIIQEYDVKAGAAAGRSLVARRFRVDNIDPVAMKGTAENAEATAAGADPMKPTATKPNQNVINQIKYMDDIIKRYGGIGNLQSIADKVVKMSAEGQWDTITKAVQDSSWRKATNVASEFFTNMLLYGPKTILMNGISGPMNVLLNLTERKVASMWGNLIGDPNAISTTALMYQMHGIKQGFRDAFRNAAKTWRTNEMGFSYGGGTYASVMDDTERRISSRYLSVNPDSWIGTAIDHLGSIVNVPSKALMATDEWAKTIAYQMELHALAAREVVGQVRSGTIPKERIGEEIRDIITNGGKYQWLRDQAVQQAKYLTFTTLASEKSITDAMLKLRHRTYVGAFVMPFINTPANILAYSLERTPLAPLTGKFRSNVAKGGVYKQQAIAQLGIGSMFLAIAADMYDEGSIIGRLSTDKEKREEQQRSGMMPYSIKMGNTYIQYNRLDPFGFLLGMGADTMDVVKAVNDNDHIVDPAEVMAGTALSFANTFLNKTYLQGAMDLVEAVSDPDRYAESYTAKMISAFATPQISKDIRQYLDPDMRAAKGWLEAIENRVPGLSEGLPPQVDVWGRNRTYRGPISAEYDFLSPIRLGSESKEPIDQEMETLRDYVAMPSKRIQVGSQEISLRDNLPAYSRYAQLAGNDYIHPVYGLGAKDFLNAVVTGGHELSANYTSLSNEEKGAFIRNVVTDYRKKARVQLFEEFPELNDQVMSKSNLTGINFQ